MERYTSLFAIALLAASSTASAAPSARAGCLFQNFTIDFASYQAIDPLPGYDYCASLKVTGSLKGRVISCGLNADFLPSHAIFGDDDYRFYAAKWFDIFETEAGTIFGTERGWADFDNGLQASMYIIEGGTGVFEDATGEFTFAPDWPSQGATATRASGYGYICPPR
jgi:hypothetical protein